MYGRKNGVSHFMQRLVLAVLFLALVIAGIAYIARVAVKTAEAHGGVSALTTGGAMQKAAFFLLLCLIIYVSASTGA